MKTYASPQDWYDGQAKWQEELAALRTHALEANLVETLKWKHPCYMDGERNVLIISVRKDGAILSFLSGALVDEPQGKFIQPGIDRSVRYIPYASVAQIEADQDYIQALLGRAIEVARAGLKVPKLPDEVDYIDELREHMAADPEYAAAFEALTPGRKRGYNLYFGKAKKSETRRDRIVKSTERVLQGKGQMDCICGRSKRPPRCDGTHNKPL